MTKQSSSTDVWNDEIYCVICSAGFVRVVDLEFHQSAHDVKSMPSELDRIAELTDEHGGETNRPEGHIGAQEVAKISKPCPKCRAPLQKNNAGDHMICPRCASQDDEVLSTQGYNRLSQSSYPNPTIRHGNYYDYPAINNPIQASGAPVYGTAPQRDLPSVASPLAFWQLPPVLHNDNTDGQEQHVLTRPEDVYQLYGSLPGQLQALEAQGDTGFGGPDQISEGQDASQKGDERSTELE